MITYIFSPLAGHTPPPQEDIELKPNPVYGVSTSEEICSTRVMYYEAMGLVFRGINNIMSSPIDHTPPQEDIELKPNPVYGVSTSEEICSIRVMYYEAMGLVDRGISTILCNLP